MVKSYDTGYIEGERNGHVAGTYLEHILDMLIIMKYLFLLSSIVLVWVNREVLLVLSTTVNWPKLLFFLTLAFAFATTVIGHLHTIRRRDIIESELLSIESQSISWKLSIIIHFRAIANSFNSSGHADISDEYHLHMMKEIRKVLSLMESKDTMFDIDEYFEDCNENALELFSNGFQSLVDDSSEDSDKSPSPREPLIKPKKQGEPEDENNPPESISSDDSAAITN